MPDRKEPLQQPRLVLVSGSMSLQHLTEEVRLTRQRGLHEWEVESEEIPMEDGTVDMLLSTEAMTGAKRRMTVEFRRLLDAGTLRPSRLVFVGMQNPSAAVLPVHVPRWEAEWLAGQPTSSVAEHCVDERVRALASDVVTRAEALAGARAWEPGSWTSVLVTNADLRVRSADRADAGDPGVSVPWLSYLTVFVVSAIRFIDFLARFRFSPPDRPTMSGRRSGRRR